MKYIIIKPVTSV